MIEVFYFIKKQTPAITKKIENAKCQHKNRTYLL